jgi:hypothetical protein
MMELESNSDMSVDLNNLIAVSLRECYWNMTSDITSCCESLEIYSNTYPTRCKFTQFIYIALAAGSSNGVTNTRCCRYSCMRSWWWAEVTPKTRRAVSRYK